MRLTFGKNRRVVHRSEFTHALRKGVGVSDQTLVLFAVAAVGNRPARLGVTIPKKVGPAVQRNRWKRLIREAFRTQQHQLPDGFDFVVRPRKGATPDWVSIRRSIPTLAGRAIKRLGTSRRSDTRSLSKRPPG